MAEPNTNRSRSRAVVLGLVAACCLTITTKASAGVMTGALQFSTNNSGALSGGQVWNSLGGDGTFNLYVTQANSGINGAFLNSGNTNPAARINVDLSTPGTYMFHTFGQPGTIQSFFGLNLFFDSDDVNPGISVFAAVDTPLSPPYPSFSANSSSTLNLQNNAPSAGAGTLVWSDGTVNVTLTDYRWSQPDVENLDRIQGLNNVPGAGNDFVGHFTLEVTSVVPEPSSLTLLGLSALSMGGYALLRRRGRATKLS